jgi:prepilin-type N-terminal cleavage/methylation domain-containing protein
MQWMMPKHDNHLVNNPIHGFTLIELSVVLLIIALIAGSGVVVGKSALESAQLASTYNRLNTIETALLAFRQNGRLPCPADGTLAASSSNFGVEAANLGSCTGGTPAANFSAIVTGSKVVEGVVPVRSAAKWSRAWFPCAP